MLGWYPGLCFLSGPNGTKGKNHFDRLCVTSCRATRSLFPCLHNSFVRDKREPSLPLPAQLEERQNNNTPENICLRRLEGRATRVTMCLCWLPQGDTCLPGALRLVPQAPAFPGLSATLACLPTHLPFGLPACLFPGKRRLCCHRRGASLSEQLAAWVHLPRPQMRRFAPALLLRHDKQRGN